MSATTKEFSKGNPPPYKVLEVEGHDYMGIFHMLARWVPYSLNGPKRQRGKGRWMTMSEWGERPLTHKERPEGWRELNDVERMKYQAKCKLFNESLL